MKTLMMLTAVPACGKSTWARAYKENHPNTYIVSSDEIRAEITNNTGDRTKEDQVWATFSKRIHEYGKIDNVTVILDALNDLNILRIKYVKENPEFDRYVLVTFPIDKERCLYLNATRSGVAKVPEEVMHILFDKFEEPSQEVKDLFDEIIDVKWEEIK